jgi:hypothetical protein
MTLFFSINTIYWHERNEVDDESTYSIKQTKLKTKMIINYFIPQTKQSSKIHMQKAYI